MTFRPLSRRGRDTSTSITPRITSLWRTHCCTGRTRPSSGSGRPPRAGSPVIRCSSGIRSSITSAVIRASSRSCASRRPSGSGTAQRCKQPAGLTDMVARRLFEAMRRYLWTFLGLTLAATPLEAQGLRDKISQLFIFADGKDPLFLGGTAGSDSATALHADHFVPSAVSDNGTLISFIGTAISQDRKSTRLNSSHTVISYAVFCLKKKKYMRKT